MNSKYEQVVNEMFKKCIADKEYKHILGIAVEARRLETIEEVLKID
jgi:26S proteasome regulatory subunit N2